METPPITIIDVVDEAFVSLEKEYINRPDVLNELRAINNLVVKWLKQHGYTGHSTIKGEHAYLS